MEPEAVSGLLDSRGYLRLKAPWGSGFKRVCDVAISAVGLTASLPLWPFVAAAVKLNSKGPVFHIQKRVGRSGRSFRLIKFRSMIENAENGEPRLGRGKRCPDHGGGTSPPKNSSR